MAAEQSLFRQQAIEARRGHWLGTIHLATPISRWVWTTLGVALAAAIVAFLVFGHYTKRARVTGQLVPSSGLLGVTTIAAGTVSRVFIHQGDAVQQGTPLLEISSDRNSAKLGSMRAGISTQLRHQRAQLRENLATQKQRTTQQVGALKTKMKLLQAQQGQVRNQLTLQAQQVANAGTLLKRFQPLLDKGYVSALQFEQQRTTLLNAETQQKSLQRQQLDLRQQIQAAEQTLAQLPLDLSTKNNTIAGQINNINQQLAQNEAERASILRAPRDGVVSTLLAKVGQHVAAGQSLASVVPQGSILQAQLLVPSRAVGFIAPGSRVVLRYQAYPYQKFGQQYGRVASVSKSALSPEEIMILSGQRPTQPLYRVSVDLKRQSIQAYGEPQMLKPGMALGADILMDRRSLVEWLFEPLYGMDQRLHTGGKAHG